MQLRSIAFWTSLIVLVLAHRVAHGGERTPTVIRAESLFEEGRRLMSAKDYAAACPKFEESQQLDPAPGTTLNLATCYERAGKLASAWALYRSAQGAATASNQKDRAALARSKADALQGKLSRLNVTVSGAARVAGLEIRCQGEPIAPAEWGVAIPRDGGSYELEATAPGKKSWTVRVELKPANQTLTVEVPVLEDQPRLPVARAEAPPKAVVVDIPEPRPRVDAAPRGNTQRVLALIAGGLGVAGLGTAGVLGLVAKSQFDKANTPTADHPEIGSHKSVKTAGMANVAAAAGAALLVTGIVLWWTTPRSTVTVGFDGSQLLVHGSF
jgi:hypothetical protein